MISASVTTVPKCLCGLVLPLPLFPIPSSSGFNGEKQKPKKDEMHVLHLPLLQPTHRKGGMTPSPKKERSTRGSPYLTYKEAPNKIPKVS